jgi:hypothetical protein
MRRQFHFLGEATEDGFLEHDREEVRQALLDLEGAVYQLGGVVTMSAVRQQIGDDRYVTTGVVIGYDSFSPAVRRQLEDEESAAELGHDQTPEDVQDGAPEPA